jgi:Protein of unknown function (DUF2934)
MDPSDNLYDRIELRAYHYWEERGRPWGTPDVDWFRAEQELTAAEPEDALSKIARAVGSAVGTVAAFLSET